MSWMYLRLGEIIFGSENITIFGSWITIFSSILSAGPGKDETSKLVCLRIGYSPNLLVYHHAAYL